MKTFDRFRTGMVKVLAHMFGQFVFRRLLLAHPSMKALMGAHAHKRFGLVVQGLDLAALAVPDRQRLQLMQEAALPTTPFKAPHVIISAPLPVLLCLIEGNLDSGGSQEEHVLVKGDTEAFKALMNMLRAANIDIAGDLSNMAGPLKGLLRPLIARVQRRQIAKYAMGATS